MTGGHVRDYGPDVDGGFNAGVDRFARLGLEVDDQVRADLIHARDMTVAALERFERDVGPLDEPGVGMFAEWVAAGTIIRTAHHESPLQPDDLDAFLPAAVNFLNTLFCPPPI
jgi:hypothetical protein